MEMTDKYTFPEKQISFQLTADVWMKDLLVGAVSPFQSDFFFPGKVWYL